MTLALRSPWNEITDAILQQRIRMKIQVNGGCNEE